MKWLYLFLFKCHCIEVEDSANLIPFFFFNFGSRNDVKATLLAFDHGTNARPRDEIMAFLLVYIYMQELKVIFISSRHFI